MAQLRQKHPQLVDKGVKVLCLGPDSAKAFRKYWQQNAMPFAGLADPDHVVAKRYAQPVRWLKLGRMPMQLIVDAEGVIRYRHDGKSMRDIPSVETILAEVARLA